MNLEYVDALELELAKVRDIARDLLRELERAPGACPSCGRAENVDCHSGCTLAAAIARAEPLLQDAARAAGGEK